MIGRINHFDNFGTYILPWSDIHLLLTITEELDTEICIYTLNQLIYYWQPIMNVMAYSLFGKVLV